MGNAKHLHWADQCAARIVAQKGDKQQYTVASGITPSGTVHIGNFREVITVELVARALHDQGKGVRFIYSWDDFDTFRKVPKNLPNQDKLHEQLRRPISRVADPFGDHESYAAGNIARFESQLARVGCSPEYLYQHQRYSSSLYAEMIRKALEQRDQIRELLNQHRTSPLPDDWLPTAIYCEACDRDEMHEQSYPGGWEYAYRCASCQHQAVTDIRTTKNLKLNWRTDWPMRWAYEGVDFEPGGKDHSSQGGSYDTAKEIVKAVFKHEPPIYLQYDFVSIKGLKGKMSSSAGVLISLEDALEVYEPQIVRWIFASQRPNHDFSLAFDADVIKTYDEFDRAEAQAFSDDVEDPKGRNAVLRRTYELSLCEPKWPARAPFRPAFRELANRLQICGGDVERTRLRFYQSETAEELDRQAFEQRAKRAWTWLSKHAPEEFCYRLNEQPVNSLLGDEVALGVAKLRELIARVDLEQVDAKELNQMIYDEAIRGSGCDGKEFFTATYQKLIGRDQGPRLPGFLKEIGRERLLELL